MNRSAKISLQARQTTGWGCVCLMASLAVGVWAASVWMSEPPWGLVMLIFGIAVLHLAVSRLKEGWRLANLAVLEEWHENGGGRVRL